MSSIIDRIKTDLESVMDRHATEIETAAGDVASLAASPVAVAIASAVHVPASVLAIIGDTVSRLDAEFAKLAEASQAAAPEPAAPDSAPEAVTGNGTGTA